MGSTGTAEQACRRYDKWRGRVLLQIDASLPGQRPDANNTSTIQVSFRYIVHFSNVLGIVTIVCCKHRIVVCSYVDV